MRVGVRAGNRRLVGFALAFIMGLRIGAVARAEPPPPPPSVSEEPPELRFEPIVVTATRLRQPLADVPAAFSLLESADIHEGRPALGLDESLARVPGVFVQNTRNFAQDLRMQIRGFGTRAAFGIREIKVLVDGLPETLPDGQTELDALDLGAAEHIEVLRAPASSLYGNASGGVIQIFTEDAPDVPTARVRVMGGSYGLGKYEVGGGGRAGRAGLSLHSSFLHLDGYRDHSAVRRGTLTSKLRYALDDATELTLLLNGLDTPRAKDPGALTRDEVRADPRQARDVSRRLDAGEQVQQGRLGMTLRHRSTRGELAAYGYALYRDFEGKLPIVPEAGDGITTLQRFSPGGGLLYQVDARLGGFAERFMLGVDAQHQDDARRRFANLEGDRGTRGLEQRERVTGVGPFVRAAWLIRDDLELSAGVRYDRVRFEVDVDVPSDATGSGTRTMEAWSPAGGIRWSARPWLSVFANVGTAFQVPTTTELANPQGAGFNPDLEPQKATSYEIGGRAAVARPGARRRRGVLPRRRRRAGHLRVRLGPQLLSQRRTIGALRARARLAGGAPVEPALVIGSDPDARPVPRLPYRRR